jgi:hypothetical protein
VRPNTTDREGAWKSVQKARKTRPTVSRLNRLDKRHNKQWPLEGKKIGCFVYLAINKATRTKFKHPECNMGSCAIPVSKYITTNCISEDKWH